MGGPTPSILMQDISGFDQSSTRPDKRPFGDICRPRRTTLPPDAERAIDLWRVQSDGDVYGISRHFATRQDLTQDQALASGHELLHSVSRAIIRGQAFSYAILSLVDMHAPA